MTPTEILKEARRLVANGQCRTPIQAVGLVFAQYRSRVEFMLARANGWKHPWYLGMAPDKSQVLAAFDEAIRRAES